MQTPLGIRTGDSKMIKMLDSSKEDTIIVKKVVT